jgi:predicted site-specific integrase-resolvase
MSQIYLSRRQAAKRAGVAANTLANYALAGFGPAFIRLHGKCLYRAEDIDGWLARHRVGGA